MDQNSGLGSLTSDLTYLLTMFLRFAFNFYIFFQTFMFYSACSVFPIFLFFQFFETVVDANNYSVSTFSFNMCSSSIF